MKEFDVIKQAYKVLGNEKYWETLNSEYSTRFGTQGFVFVLNVIKEYNILEEDECEHINFESVHSELTLTMFPESWDNLYSYMNSLQKHYTKTHSKTFVKDVLSRVSNKTTASVLYDAILSPQSGLSRKERIEFIKKYAQA